MPEKGPTIAIRKMRPYTRGQNSVKTVTKGSSMRTGGLCPRYLYLKEALAEYHFID